MTIRWLERKDDFGGLPITSSLMKFIWTSKKPRNTYPELRIVFNSRMQASAFLNAFSQFSFNLNTQNIQLGIAEPGTGTDMRLENILVSDIPLVFLGNELQMKGFLKMFDDKATLISRSCKSRYRTIAYQRHLSDKVHLGSVSLGEFKSDFGRAESTLRNAHAIVFELNAIRRQDSYFEQSAITGLDIYEACQVLRFCGLSTEHFFLFFNIGPAEALNPGSWECLATLFWYYLEGKNQHQVDHADHEDNHVYMVENEYFTRPVSFIKAYQTKRWWFIHPETGDKVPCSEQDYICFREGNLPDIMLSLTLG